MASHILLWCSPFMPLYQKQVFQHQKWLLFSEFCFMWLALASQVGRERDGIKLLTAASFCLSIRSMPAVCFVCAKCHMTATWQGHTPFEMWYMVQYMVMILRLWLLAAEDVEKINKRVDSTHSLLITYKHNGCTSSQQLKVINNVQWWLLDTRGLHLGNQDHLHTIFKCSQLWRPTVKNEHAGQNFLLHFLSLSLALPLTFSTCMNTHTQTHAHAHIENRHESSCIVFLRSNPW